MTGNGTIPLLLEGVAFGRGSDARDWPKAILNTKSAQANPQGRLTPICSYLYPALRAPLLGEGELAVAGSVLGGIRYYLPSQGTPRRRDGRRWRETRHERLGMFEN